MNVSRKGLAVVAALAIALITGCTLPRPPGDSPLRYRDQVFSNVSITSDLKYGQAPDANNNPVDLKLDLYQPTGDTQTQRPALVWVHGGGFSRRRQDELRPVDVANTFAKMGYVVVSINYRLLGSGCVGATRSPPSCSPRSRPSTTPRRRCAGCAPTPPPTRSTRRGSASAASRPARSPRRGRACTRRTRAPAATPAPPSAVGGFVSVSGGAAERPLRQRRRRAGLLFHGTAEAVSPTSGRSDHRGDAQGGRRPRGSDPGRRGPRAMGAVPRSSTSSRRTTSST